MIPLLIFAAGVLLGAALVYLPAREARAAHALERESSLRERGELLNRIKPETAQYVPPADLPEMPRAVTFDDDDDYWSTLGPSKEELADALMRQETEGVGDGAA